ncbi:MAG: hypothetical protein L6Q71_03605 [Planctomycetes bacterium]|nr:hypothetical protein [Planctomycetota bacterium]NUQ34532.1 hypothetical protein [Planctomycetaceae bacterium]
MAGVVVLVALLVGCAIFASHDQEFAKWSSIILPAIIWPACILTLAALFRNPINKCIENIAGLIPRIREATPSGIKFRTDDISRKLANQIQQLPKDADNSQILKVVQREIGPAVVIPRYGGGKHNEETDLGLLYRYLNILEDTKNDGIFQEMNGNSPKGRRGRDVLARAADDGIIQNLEWKELDNVEPGRVGFKAELTDLGKQILDVLKAQ